MNAQPDQSQFTTNSVELEQSLIGTCLSDRSALAAVTGEVEADQFSEALHQTVWDTMTDLMARGSVANILTVCTFLGNPIVGEGMKLSQYLAKCAANTYCPPAYALDFAKRVKTAWALREIVLTAEAAKVASEEPGSDPAYLIGEMMQGLDLARVRMDPKRYGFHSAGQVTAEVTDRMAAAYQNDGRYNAVSTGLTDLDSKLMGGFHRGDFIIMAGRPGMGKAQPLSAMVRTTAGWKPMGEIKFGERLKSIDGSQSFVNGIFPQGRKKVFKVEFSDGRTTRCCDEHLWRVFYRSWDEPRILTTAAVRELLTKKRYQKRLWIDLAPSADWGGRVDVKLPIDPWVLGAILGDGGITHGTSFTTASPQILAQLEARLPVETVVVKNTGSRFGYYISSRTHRTHPNGVRVAEVRESLRDLGLLGLGSHEKFIPRTYLDAPAYSRLQLVRGLLDTDGWVEKHGTVRFCTTSLRLALETQELARSLGAWCRMSSKTTRYTLHGEKKVGRTAYVLNICHPNPRELFTLAEKRARAAPTQPIRKMPLFISIVPDGEEDCRCISVTHASHLYFTDDYVVTHNSLSGVSISRQSAIAGHGVGFYSLEMVRDQIGARFISDHVFQHGDHALSSGQILNGKVSERQAEDTMEGAKSFAELPIEIDDSSSMTVGEVTARTRSLADKFARKGRKLDLIIIDYLKFVRASDRYKGQRHYEVGEISSGLKGLAKDLGIAVVLLAQLNREVEKRANKRPELSDLRESGDLEADADVVIFLYREAYYLQANEPAPGSEEHLKWQDDMARCHNKLEMIIAKQRMGPTGSVEVFCHPGASALRDLGRDFQLPEGRY